MGECNEMKEKNKILVTILVLVIIILAAFAVVIEYRFGVFAKIGEEKLPLVAKIFATENSGTTPFKANFTSLVLYYEGDIKYHWDFGDNETSDAINPTHIYNKSGSYICTLTVTDKSGEKSTDRIEISSSGNQAPTVSIILSDLNPSRPFIPILRRGLISIAYSGRTLRQLIDLKIIPASLLNRKGFVSCDAQATDPEGDEIVSYKWELKPTPYSTNLGQQKKPIYYFEGKNLTIPMLYTYPTGIYDLTLIATDSAGNKGTSTIKFTVIESPTEVRIFTVKYKINMFRTNIWHDILKASLSGPVGSLIYDRVFSKLPSWPLIKLLIVLQLSTKWALSPESSLTTQLLGKFLNKHPKLQNIVEKNLERTISFLEKIKVKRPKLAGTIDNLIDTIEKLSENLGLANKRPAISNEVPADKSKHLSTSYPEVAVTVEDPEGDPFNITIHGTYVNNITLLNQHNDTFIATLISPLPNLTDIYWYVNVSYSGDKWINATYKFSTW